MPLRNPFASSSRASVNTQSSSAHTRPPTYTSNATPAPTYASNTPRTTHNNTHRRNESFTMLAAPLRSGPSIASTDSTLLNNTESESSITDTLSTEDTSAETSRPEGLRYSELNGIDCWNLLSYPVFQSTTGYTPQMGQPNQ